MQNLQKIIWKTNYNGKMACQGFVHFDFGPQKKVSYEQLDAMPNFIIETEDNSHPPIEVKIIDMLYVPILQKLPAAFTLASHGMMEKEFVDYLFATKSAEMPKATELCLWFYKKVGAACLHKNTYAINQKYDQCRDCEAIID